MENANDELKAVISLCEPKYYPIGSKKSTDIQVKTLIAEIEENLQRLGEKYFSNDLFDI